MGCTFLFFDSAPPLIVRANDEARFDQGHRQRGNALRGSVERIHVHRGGDLDAGDRLVLNDFKRTKRGGATVMPFTTPLMTFGIGRSKRAIVKNFQSCCCGSRKR